MGYIYPSLVRIDKLGQYNNTPEDEIVFKGTKIRKKSFGKV